MENFLKVKLNLIIQYIFFKAHTWFYSFYTDIKENILLEVEKKFDIAKLDLTQEGRSIIGTLLKSKEVGYLEFKKVFGKVEGFNGMNIFTYHHKARSVTFQSRPIELYIKSKFKFPQYIAESANEYNFTT